MFRLTIIVVVILSLNHDNFAQEVSAPDNQVFVDTLNLFKKIDIDINDAQICEPPKRCVHHYQCRPDAAFNIRGVDIIGPRFSGDDTKTIIDGNITYEVPLNNTILLRNGVSAKVCLILEQCCGTKPIPRVTPPTASTAGCGYRNPDGLFFKINRTDKAEYCEFPWMVAVLGNHPIKNLPVLLGGASLIHPNVILTAAHILQDKTANELKVRAGEWNTQTEDETVPVQERNVKQIIRHESFEKDSLLNDYALLVVDQEFVLDVNIQPICLPTKNLLFDGELDCYSAGWGKDRFSNKGLRQNIMKKIKLPIVSFDTCQEQLRQTQLGDIFELHESFVCAGGKLGQDTCTGDGGSPLMCPVYNQPNRYYQTGIVAWGLDCGRENVPGAYANVAFAREWIDDKMASLGYGTDSYTIK